MGFPLENLKQLLEIKKQTTKNNNKYVCTWKRIRRNKFGSVYHW